MHSATSGMVVFTIEEASTSPSPWTAASRAGVRAAKAVAVVRTACRAHASSTQTRAPPVSVRPTRLRGDAGDCGSSGTTGSDP